MDALILLNILLHPQTQLVARKSTGQILPFLSIGQLIFNIPFFSLCSYWLLIKDATSCTFMLTIWTFSLSKKTACSTQLAYVLRPKNKIVRKINHSTMSCPKARLGTCSELVWELCSLFIIYIEHRRARFTKI